MERRPEEPEDTGDRPSERRQDEPGESLSFWQIVGSTLAAAFGVQSSRNRERDFTRGKPIHFLVAGILFTVLFVLMLILVVSAVL